MAGMRRAIGRGLGGVALAMVLLAIPVWRAQAPVGGQNPALPAAEAPAQPAPPPRPSIHGRRGVYLTSYALARPGFLEGILAQLSAHGLDTVVVNVKNMHGEVCYKSAVELAGRIGAVAPRLDLPAILQAIHARGMYAIARQVVFYDPKLARYLGTGAQWVLPTDEAAISYNLELAREIEAAGFDELQLDYIRFPDGGKIGEDYADRCRAVEAFLARVREAVSLPVSADVFGRVMWPWNARGIDPIGQRLEGIAQEVDVVSPMLYPSHYVERSLKEDPYRTVSLALTYGHERVDTPLRPYLQAFDRDVPASLGLPAYIAAQIRAAEDSGADGYLFWDPGSDYTALWRALELSGR